MEINIRQEKAGELQEIAYLVAKAFLGVEESDHREQFLVERLHRSNHYVPQLSLVAEAEGLLVGYVLLTELEIVTQKGSITSLAVAPLAVHPDFQRQGVGAKLLKAAHGIAASLGYGSAVLLGHKDYYPRFGYRQASDFGIDFPIDAPKECCMAIELMDNALAEAAGVVRYPDEFFG